MANGIFVIAEGAANHNGSLDIAKKLIKEAKTCGADAVKFQIFRAEDLMVEGTKKTAHLKNIKRGKSAFSAIKELEFDRDEYLELVKCARKAKIMLFASVFDIKSLGLAVEIGFPIIKIPSGEIVNLELLKEASRCERPIILSTGMSNMDEVHRAVNTVLKGLKVRKNLNRGLVENFPFFQKGLVLMHAVSTYPAPPEELNLRTICTLKSEFNLPVGYSDHSVADEACLLAVSLGAELVEKHFTLDRRMAGPDHSSSIEPRGLKSLVEKMNAVKDMLGAGVKGPSRSEKKMLKIFRRSIMAARNIKKGQYIKRSDVCFKRAPQGLPMENFDKIKGSKVKVDILKSSPLLKEYLLPRKN